MKGEIVADFQSVTLSGNRVVVSDDSLGKSGKVFDADGDGKVDYFVAGDGPSQWVSNNLRYLWFDPDQPQKMCREDSQNTQRITVTNPNWQGAAKLFGTGGRRECDVPSASATPEDTALVGQADAILSEGKQRGEKIYTDFISAFKARVSSAWQDPDSYLQDAFLDSRGREISVDIRTNENGKVVSVSLFDSGDPTDPAMSMTASDYIDLTVDDPNLLQPVQEELDRAYRLRSEAIARLQSLEFSPPQEAKK